MVDAVDAQFPTPAGWPGAVNAWRLRHGLWRMGRAEWVTGPGWEAMAHDGVRSVVDLRTAPEVGRRPTDGDEAAVPDGLRRENLPVEDPEHADFWARNHPYPNHPGAYPDHLASFPGLVAAALRGVRADWMDGGVVVHCSAGRDRTGLVVALLLQLDDIPGGPADWAEQARVYAAGVHGINEYRRTATVPHPHERYVPAEAFDEHLGARLADLRAFLAEWPGERVRALMDRGD